MSPGLRGILRDCAAPLALASLAGACEPHLAVGVWDCPSPGTSPDGGVVMGFDVPWKTGFETGFCDYERTGGFCYGDPDTSYGIVTTPVRSGRHAAAFSIKLDPQLDGDQARCFLQGEMPRAATYGAWLYLPSAPQAASNWNLFHFPSGAPPDAWHGVWDVSAGIAADGTPSLYVLDARTGVPLTPSRRVPIPIGSWFHVEFRLVRAKDANGEVALYQDGTLLVERQSIVTDDAELGQWYVGNLANALTPDESTIFVDDVTITLLP